MHNCNTFGARMSHKQTRTHKIHHDPYFGEATTFPLIVFFVLGHGAYTQMSFCLGTPNFGVPKFPKLRLLQLWRPITLCVDLRLKWGLKRSCSPCLELFNFLWKTTYTQGNKGNYWLLAVGSQFDNLTLGPFFGHNLCFKYPNGSCEPISNIKIPRI
jgi:hypothetical protein